MTGAVSHSQPAVSEFTWQDLSDASAEEGPDGFVFYNENDKGLDASGDPREATIQPEVGETGGERGGVGRGGGGRGGGGRGGGGRGGGGSGGGGRSGGGRGGGGSGGGGSGGGGSGGERDHDDADASVLHENHQFNSASSLPEEFVGHASVASLVNACETFAAQHNFVVQVKGFKYFTADATDATSTPPDDDGDPARSKAIDLGRVKLGQVECHHFGKKRAKKTSKVDPTRQRNKPSQKLGCGWHINFRVAVPGGSPEVGYVKKTGKESGQPSFCLEHIGHDCNPTNAQYISRSIPEEAKEFIQGMIAARVPAVNIRHYLRQNFPDSKFSNKDLDNYIQHCRGDSSEDAQNLLSNLFEKQRGDPMMTVSTKMDADGALQVIHFPPRQSFSFAYPVSP